MDNYSLNSFSFDYKNIVIDEIALNGLEGIGFDFLWKMVEKRISAPVTAKMKNRFWNFIVNCDAVTVYNLPAPVPRLEVLNRFDIIDNETGYVVDTPDYLDGPYEYCPIENEFGSCSSYKQRKLIPKKHLVDSSYTEVEEKYGDHLVMVASLEERWKSLASHAPISLLEHMTPVHYCMLELIGKSRENGQTSLGKTNLIKIYKESKFLFYNRKFLGSIDLICVVRLPLIVKDRLAKSLLLRLKRFHKPSIMTIPNKGKIRDLIDYMTKQPNYTAKVNELSAKGLMTPAFAKKLRKTNKKFQFDVKPLENPLEKDTKAKIAARKIVSLTIPSDEESEESDEESQDTPIQCQYKVKVPLMRQAHECLMKAGLKGLTQCELAQVLNVEFYTARLMCRIFKRQNLVRIILEDKGKQRSKRYISVTGTSEMDVQFEEEKKKFQQYTNEIRDSQQTTETEENNTSINMNEDEIPPKKIKLEEGETSTQNFIDYKNYLQHIKEITLIEGLAEKEDVSPLFSSNKPPTLRQLKYVNGIFKVLSDIKIVSGYTTLSTKVAKEIKEPPMDTKRFKYILQRLVSDKKLKIYKMKRPGHKDTYDILICAADIKPTDPALKSKYKELSTRAINNNKFLKTKAARVNSEPNLAHYSYPKYMKLRKLHEFIVKFVYFDKPEGRDSDLPEGFSSLVQLIPEFTVEFALGNVSSAAMVVIPTKKINDEILKLKLREAPNDISNTFILSSSLQFSIRSGLKILAMFGLIQLIKETSPVYNENIVLSYIFYVNRHAKILNTAGEWPRPVVDEDSLQKNYYFSSFEDVERFWNDVYEISTKTTIDLPQRPTKKIISPVRSMEEVHSNDNGQRFGDGLGACGYDSMFYLDMPRFWSTFYFKQKKSSSQLMQKKPPIKAITLPKKEVKKTIKKKPICRSRKKPISKTKSTLKPLMKKKRVKADTSITWTPEEDNILLYCKIAILIMSPTTQPGSLRLRNLVAKDILSLRDPKKDAQTCHKRALFIETNSRLAHEKDCILAELQHRKNLTQKYEGLFRTLRVQSVGSLAKSMFVGRKLMLELVYLITKLVKSKSYKRRNPCVALDYEDFHKQFTIKTNHNTNSITYNKSEEEPDCGIATIKEAIILALMASFKTELLPETAKKIRNMLNVFPDAQLRLAVEQLRRCSAIAAKEKLFNNHLSRYNYKGAIVQSSYRIANAYERKFINRLNSEFMQELFGYVDNTPPMDALKGSPGLNCLMCELLACDKVHIFSITTTAVTNTLGDILEDYVSASEIETKFTLKAGLCGWRNKGDVKLKEIYKDLNVEKEQLTCTSIDISKKDVGQIDDNIVKYLKERKEKGSTFMKLQEFTGYDIKTLCEKLQHLESENVVTLVGFHENVLVLTEYMEPWTVALNNTRCIPLPWLSFDGVRYDIFLKWTSAVLNKVFENPGLSISYIAEVCEHLTPRSTQEICSFLEKYKCVSIKVILVEEPGLFSNDDAVPQLMDFYKYASMKNILVFPLKDSLIRFTYVKKVLLDKNKCEKNKA